MTRGAGKLALGHIAANAVLLGCGYVWLGIGVGRTSELLENLLLVLLLIVIACSAYGAAFAFFGSRERKMLLPAWKSAARNILPLAVVAIAAVGLYWLLSVLETWSSGPAFTLSSYLTLTFRKPVTPASVQNIFGWVFFLIRWAVLPVLLLPAFAAISTSGWSGFKAAGAGVKRWWFWLAAPLLLLAAMRLPFTVLDWKPHASSFAQEMSSFVLRALLAYLLFAAGWLALAFATSAGKPRLTQPSTPDSP